ncbi:hypothetical protein AVEN_201735-2-1, partial [Araneus ventricosus]
KWIPSSQQRFRPVQTE